MFFNRRPHFLASPFLVFALVVSPLFMGGSGNAAAQQAAPLPPKTAQPAPAPSTSETGLVMARQLVVASGMSRSFAVIIPQYMDQIATALTQTRPELIRDLNDVMLDLKPEFDKQADEMIDLAAHIYVRLLTEQDMKTALAFYQSESGRRFVETQPVFLNELLTAMQGWQSKISTDMMTRVRVEMKKKGHDF
ncbi:conserved hypothetical protein [Beijerinckia indica subsp. indica ATCC 9039]|uniref:DUF2059 domain-containing protein n=2 Tax=Beijerinckia TaxID=532 RepID=B2IHK9_BEII9|nr:conserved hypothetical protein [Beijerinckia indica subsp. indica ATCC 9039]